MPEPGALVISLDFELFWGMRDVISLADYRANLEGVPTAIARTLELFERRNIHATWACVGLLFAHDAADARSFGPEALPSYRNQAFSPFEAIERGEVDEDPGCYFAPASIERIRACPHQEIGTHTFSHYYCNEAGQTAEQFDADLAAAVAIAKRSGIELESLVFPRNQSNEDYLPILARHGITSYRGLTDHWAYEAGRSRADTLVRRGLRLADNYAPLCPAPAMSPTTLERRDSVLNIPGSRFLRPYSPRLQALDELRIRRMQDEMSAAAAAGEVYHLWWHPHNFGVYQTNNFAILDRLLRHANHLSERHGLRSMTMAELTKATAELARDPAAA